MGRHAHRDLLKMLIFYLIHTVNAGVLTAVYPSPLRSKSALFPVWNPMNTFRTLGTA